MKNPKMCHICLRTDKELKRVHYLLSEFHDELCEFVLNTDSLLYCMECTHLLRKTYNFHVKCKTAAEVLKNWKKAKSSNRKSLELLYQELPPSTLGMWKPDNAAIFMYESDDKGNTIRLYSKSDAVDSNTKRVLMEDNNLNDDVISIKREDDSSEIQLNLEMVDEQKTEKLFVTLQDDDKLLVDFNITNDDLKNVLQTDSLDGECFNKSTDPISNVSNKKTLADLANIDLIGDVQTVNEVTGDVLPKEQTVDDDTTDGSDLGDQWKLVGIDFESSDDEDYELMKTIVDVAPKTKLVKGKGRKQKKRDEIMKFMKLEPKQKENLKEMIRTKFQSCGELSLKNGAKIDKKLILDNFPEEVDDLTLKRLWIKLIGKQRLMPSAVILLKSIQDIYQLKSQYNTVFDIEYLDTKEKVLEEFQNRKTYECYLNAKHKCEICFLPQNFNMVKIHKAYHEESAGDIVCNICTVRAKSKIRMASHVRYSHKVVYKCKLCPLVTYYSSSMINHYNYHNGKRYMCKICGVSYKSKSTYNTHRTRHVTPYACAACGRSFVSPLPLKSHIKKMHKDQPMDSCTVHCEVCKLGFTSVEALNTHRIAHRDKKFYSHAFNSITKKKVSKEKKGTTKCHMCDAKGKGGGWKSYHYRTEHPDVDWEQLIAHKKIYLCQYCAKRFTSMNLLREHINIHTGERPFACNKCPRKFYKKQSLKDHMLWHYPPKEVCHQCGKKFHTKSCLYNHTLSHIGNRRYKCKICEKGFVSSALLNEHFRGVHLQVRRAKRKATGEEGEKRRKKKIRYVSEENSE